jgi:hypothetical protein
MNPLNYVSNFVSSIAGAYREWVQKQRRIREAGVRPGQKVQDGLTGDFLQVSQIRDEKARERMIEDVPLNVHEANDKLDCASDWTVECIDSTGEHSYIFPASRLKKLKIKRGKIVRDRFTGETLKVRRIRYEVAQNVLVDGTPLVDVGLNNKLDCGDDWIAECTYYGSKERHQFPFSRLAPERIPTRPESWKEEIINTQDCYSCKEGVKDSERNAACQNCRDRIKQRDEYECQQEGCSSTSKLHVHHLYYEPNMTGLIPDQNLITLCESCHADRHGIPE